MRRAGPAWFVVLAAACSGSSKPGAAPVFEPRLIQGFQSTLWTGALEPDDPVVARVNGTPITRQMLERQLGRAGEDVSPRAVLERMIEFELLARQAFEAGLYSPEVVGPDMKAALAKAWIRDQFEVKLQPSAIPPEYRERAYSFMKPAFDHFTRFKIADAQILCCDRGNPEACFTNLFDDVKERVAHYEACFEYHAEAAEKLRAALASAQTLERFEERYQVASMDIPEEALRIQFGSKALLAKYQFQYDVGRTWDEQFGPGVHITYTPFAQPVMDGAREAWLGAGRTTPAVSKVLKSEFGYHVLFVYEVEPEKHMPLSAPEVQRAIEDNAFAPWREIHFRERMERLCGEAGCEVHHQRLVPLQEPRAAGQ